MRNLFDPTHLSVLAMSGDDTDRFAAFTTLGFFQHEGVMPMQRGAVL